MTTASFVQRPQSRTPKPRAGYLLSDARSRAAGRLLPHEAGAGRRIIHVRVSRRDQ
jgi:hypothetical protein